MIFVINGLKYDTEKMEHIADVKKWYKTESWLIQQITGRDDVGSYYDCKLWRSKSGRYLLIHETDYKYKAEALDEDEAKRLLLMGNVKKYEELYGEIPEA